FVAGCQRDDQISTHINLSARRHNQTAIRDACEYLDGAFDLSVVPHIDWGYFYSEGRRPGLDVGVYAFFRNLVWIPKNCHSRYSWSGLLEQFQPFPAQTVFKRHKAGRVAAGPRQTVDKTGADRIAGNREHDRHGARRL